LIQYVSFWLVYFDGLSDRLTPTWHVATNNPRDKSRKVLHGKC